MAHWAIVVRSSCLGRAVFWASVTIIGWPIAQPSPALAQAPAWEPELIHIERLDPGPRSIFYSAREGTLIAIHGTRLMPVVMDKDERGREVRVALELVRIGIGPTAWFEGRAGGVLIFREYRVQVGDVTLRLDGRPGGEAAWTDSLIIGRMQAGLATGEHSVSIRGSSRHGITDALSNELRVRVIAGDEDGDGHEKPVVGGDDCDDLDRNRYPGADEVADFDAYDEDCNPMTIGRLDRDEDGHHDSRVCNWISHTETLCGDDCDDGFVRVHPGQVETCDGLDNDCNELVDDRLLSCKTPADTRRPIPEPSEVNRPEPEITFAPAGTVVTTIPEIESCPCK